MAGCFLYCGILISVQAITAYWFEKAILSTVFFLSTGLIIAGFGINSLWNTEGSKEKTMQNRWYARIMAGFALLLTVLFVGEMLIISA